MNGSGLGPGGSLRCRVLYIHLENSKVQVRTRRQALRDTSLEMTGRGPKADMVSTERWVPLNFCSGCFKVDDITVYIHGERKKLPGRGASTRTRKYVAHFTGATISVNKKIGSH
jgi:hypothetical protein